MARLTQAARRRLKKRRIREQVEAGIRALDAPLAPQPARIWPSNPDTYPSGFYVYRLLDPRDGSAFYVGKGRHKRAWDHARAVRSGRLGANAQKVEAIRSILAAGYQVQVEVVGQYALEADALDHEYRLVDATPGLTNILPGGLGAAETLAQVERRRRARSVQREAARRAAIVRDLERTRVQLLAETSDPNQRAKVNTWIDGFVQRGEMINLAVPALSPKASMEALKEFRASKPF